MFALAIFIYFLLQEWEAMGSLSPQRLLIKLIKYSAHSKIWISDKQGIVFSPMKYLEHIYTDGLSVNTIRSQTISCLQL